MGINQYPGLTSLAGPENDADAFYDWLVDPEGGNVPADNVALIKSSNYPQVATASAAQPTTQAFEVAVDLLHERGETAGGEVGRRLYLYFAGHGFAHNNRSAALLMANATPTASGHHVPGDLYAEWFAVAAFFQEVVLFMDCCRGVSPQTAPNPCHLPPLYSSHPAVTYYVFATKYSAAARERQEEGEVPRGYFTSALVAGLREAIDADGNITGTSIKDFFATWYIQHAPDLELPVVFPDPEDNEVAFRTGLEPTYRFTVKVDSGDLREVHLQRGDADFTPIPPTSHVGSNWSWDLSQRGLYRYGLGDDLKHTLVVDGTTEAIDVKL
jgi:hypothetical protein